MKPLKDVWKNIKKGTIKHSPEIMIGFGLAGMLSSCIFAARAGVKSKQIIEEKRKTGEKIEKPIEVVKATWKCWIPTATTFVLSGGCIVYSDRIRAKRYTALATAYALTETAFSEYKQKVVETIGEKKHKAMMDDIAKDKVETHPVDNTQVIVTGKGKTLCYDPMTDRYFEQDIETIRQVVNDLNARLLSEMVLSLNEFYYAIGLPPAKAGDALGWNVERGLISVNFSAQLTDKNEPCLVINFDYAPVYDFKDIYGA